MSDRHIPLGDAVLGEEDRLACVGSDMGHLVGVSKTGVIARLMGFCETSIWDMQSRMCWYDLSYGERDACIERNMGLLVSIHQNLKTDQNVIE